MTKSNQPYRYLKTDSIVNGNFDYELSQEEYYQLYSFYVTYSLCENQSHRRRTFSDYGWQTEKIQLKNRSATDLGKALKSCINLSDSNFIFNDSTVFKFIPYIKGIIIAVRQKRKVKKIILTIIV